MVRDLIRVPKKLFSKNKDKKDTLSGLEKKIMKVASRYMQYGFIDPTEENFLDMYKDKKVLIELRNSQNKEGLLKSIDKYRMSIEIDGCIHSYYKHAIVSYSSNEEPNPIEEDTQQT